MLSAGVFFPAYIPAQAYPEKPITVYCSYAAGATTDLTTRSLAEGAEKLLGVPVVVENKPGGTSTVCASLIASRKLDGYSLAVISTGALNLLPHEIVLQPPEGFHHQTGRSWKREIPVQYEWVKSFLTKIGVKK